MGGSVTVGGGFAVHLLSQKLPEENLYKTVLTRLTDGATWEILPRPDFLWAGGLYVDAEELALLEAPGKEIFQELGLKSGVQWTIVRYPIDSLGPPALP